jgi:RNA polymerase sigma-70 factor (ECF subfamily)
MDQEDFARRTLEIEYSLYRVAKTLLRDDNDCADAVQDALLKGLAGMKTLQQAEYFKTWMTRILINTCKDIMKKRSRRPWQEIPETLPAPDTTEQQELYTAPSSRRLSAHMPVRWGGCCLIRFRAAQKLIKLVIYYTVQFSMEEQRPY